MGRMEDVGYSRHANCIDGHSQDMAGPVFKVRPGQPVIVVATKRRFVDGVFREEEIGPEFIDGLRKWLGYAGAQRRCNGLGLGSRCGATCRSDESFWCQDRI